MPASINTIRELVDENLHTTENAVELTLKIRVADSGMILVNGRPTNRKGYNDGGRQTLAFVGLVYDEFFHRHVRPRQAP